MWAETVMILHPPTMQMLPWGRIGVVLGVEYLKWYIDVIEV